MAIARIFRSSLAILIMVALVQLTEQLKFSAVQIPSLVQRNTNFWLSCQYNLENQFLKQDQLYSVKWYKNNEEFYRLLLTQQMDQTVSSSQDETSLSNPNQQQQQQQLYFAQAGVNVMMSSSNATHVRLLNASLESEGIYACEISTQNLSTIRYEREIRVYVLPQTRLNIIGFRNGYSLGDKVDLICSSDFSRPKPALAWFINGQRIGGQLNVRGRWFEQELETRSKLQEPSLFKLNLRLKFKLSHEFLQAFTMQNKTRRKLDQGTTNSSSNDQSQTTRQQQSSSAAIAAAERFELQCRYKLTEVSDVTYNELTLTRQQASSFNGARGSKQPQDSTLPVGKQINPSVALARGLVGWGRSATAANSAKWSNNGEADEVDANRKRSSRRVGRSVKNPLAGDGGFVRVDKAPDGNQVTQSKSPANGRQLWRSIYLQNNRKQREQASCQLGSLVLSPGDPLLIEPIGRERRSMGAENQDQIQEESGLETMMMMIRVNCSTASALETTIGASNGDDDDHDLVETQTGSHRWLRWRSSGMDEGGDEGQDNEDNDDDDGDGGAGQAASSPASNAATSLRNLRNEPAGRSAGYCGDQAAQRRSLVSGKGLIVDEFPTSSHSSSQAHSRSRSSGHNSISKHQVGRQLVAYLSLANYSNTASYPNLTTTTTATQNNEANSIGADSLLSPLDNNDEIDAQSLQPKHHQFSSPMMTTTTTTTIGTGTWAAPTNADSSDSPEGGPSARTPLAPPLLEWFINNQEAPRASASYSPELPLLKLSPSEFRLAEQLTMATGAAQSKSGANVAEVLPPIDYADYFANYDSRPQRQHLMLNLKPDKRHFLTTDSRLRLRCSSTQAQVLVSDFATLTIVPLTSTGLAVKAQGQGWQARSRLLKQQQQQQQKGAINQARASRVSSSSASAGTRSSPGGSGAQVRQRPSTGTIIGLLATSLTIILTLHSC